MSEQTLTERYLSIHAVLLRQRTFTSDPDEARHLSIAITHLEESLMHKNRAEAINQGNAIWWDPEKEGNRQ